MKLFHQIVHKIVITKQLLAKLHNPNEMTVRSFDIVTITGNLTIHLTGQYSLLVNYFRLLQLNDFTKTDHLSPLLNRSPGQDQSIWPTTRYSSLRPDCPVYGRRYLTHRHAIQTAIYPTRLLNPVLDRLAHHQSLYHSTGLLCLQIIY